MTILSSVFYFHVSLRKQPTFHEATVSWFPCEMMAASLPRWTWYSGHFANKTIGSLAKCWLFSQAISMLA